LFSIDFRIKTLLIGGLRVKCQVWDTAGQERFRVITNAYYRGAHGVLLVYDVTDQASFDDIGNWVKNIETCADASVRCILVGNKCDMSTDRLVSTERGQALADSFGIKFFETSAKTGMQVNECFTTLTQDILDTRKSKEGQDSGSGSIGIVPLSHPLHKDTRTKCCK
jgi:Ras-related protein Rab-8A